MRVFPVLALLVVLVACAPPEEMGVFPGAGTVAERELFVAAALDTLAREHPDWVGSTVVLDREIFYRHVDGGTLLRTAETMVVGRGDAARLSTAFVEERMEPDAPWRVMGVEAWVRRVDGAYVEAEPEWLRIVQGDRQRATTVVVEWPALGEGDVVHVDRSLRSDATFASMRFAQGDRRALRTRVTSRSGPSRTFRTLAHNVAAAQLTSRRTIDPDSDGLRTSTESVLLRGVEPQRGGLLTPSRARLRPSVQIVLEAEAYGDYWFQATSANYLALRHGWWIADRLEVDEMLRRDASRVTLGRDDPWERADAVHRWVRDNVRLREGDGWLYDVRRPREVLAAGEGTAWERTFLLAALLRAGGVDARVLFTRNRAVGSWNDPVFGLHVFTDVLVRSVDDEGGERWYDLTDARVGPGEISPALRACQAVEILPVRGEDAEGFGSITRFGDDEEREKLDYLARHGANSDWAWTEFLSRRAAENAEQVAEVMNALLTSKEWSSVHVTPGGAGRLAGRTTELLLVDPLRPQAEIIATGTGIASALAVDFDGAAAAARYVRERFGREPVGEAVAVVAPIDSLRRVEAAVPVRVAPPTGDTWTLEPGAVFGRSFFDAWDSRGDHAIDVPATSEYAWTTLIARPPGWSGVSLPEGVEVALEPFDYRISFEADAQGLVVRRDLVLRGGYYDDPEVRAAADRAVAEVLAVERAPLRLERTDG